MCFILLFLLLVPTAPPPLATVSRLGWAGLGWAVCHRWLRRSYSSQPKPRCTVTQLVLVNPRTPIQYSSAHYCNVLFFSSRRLVLFSPSIPLLSCPVAYRTVPLLPRSLAHPLVWLRCLTLPSCTCVSSTDSDTLPYPCPTPALPLHRPFRTLPAARGCTRVVVRPDPRFASAFSPLPPIFDISLFSLSATLPFPEILYPIRSLVLLASSRPSFPSRLVLSPCRIYSTRCVRLSLHAIQTRQKSIQH